MCAYQGVRNVNFSENFAYVLNGWPQRVSYISCQSSPTFSPPPVRIHKEVQSATLNKELFLQPSPPLPIIFSPQNTLSLCTKNKVFY